MGKSQRYLNGLMTPVGTRSINGSLIHGKTPDLEDPESYKFCSLHNDVGDIECW